MNIVIDPLNAASVNAALNQIKQYEQDFKRREDEFLRRIAEIGVSVAQAGYASADYDGDNDVSVSLVKTSDGYSVVASGKAVGFIEFGTGIRYPEADTSDIEYTPPKHGTYGRGWGNNPKGWFFAPGRHTYGNPPAEAMLTARDTMVERVMEIAREVWG